MSKVSAVIINYQSDQQTKSLAESLRSLEPIQEVIVIDNSINNRGFSRAANIGVRQALGKDIDFILLINPDVTFEKESLEEFLTNPTRDITSPVIKFLRNAQWVFDYGGKINWLIGRPDHLSQPSLQVDYTTGACMLVNRQVFETIGLFDESYFLYFEDVDFCLRAKKAGFQILVDQNTIVDHRIAEHRISKNKFKMRQNLKSNLVFINKWIAWYFKPVAYGYFFLLLGKVLFRIISNRLSANRH